MANKKVEISLLVPEFATQDYPVSSVDFLKKETYIATGINTTQDNKSTHIKNN